MSEALLIALVGVFSTLVGGGGMWVFLNGRADRSERREDKEIERSRSDLASEKKSHQECLDRLDAVEKRLEVVEHHHGSLLPRWVKDASKRICWVNGQAMAAIFGPLGYTRDAIDGRTFQDLLDMEAAAEVDRLDRAALAQPGTAVASMIQLHHSLPVMMIVKVAGIGRDQELIYEGHAFRTDDAERVIHRAVRREEEQIGLSILRLTNDADLRASPEGQD
jgi:hypothetical protein